MPTLGTMDFKREGGREPPLKQVSKMKWAKVSAQLEKNKAVKVLLGKEEKRRMVSHHSAQDIRPDTFVTIPFGGCGPSFSACQSSCPLPLNVATPKWLAQVWLVGSFCDVSSSTLFFCPSSITASTISLSPRLEGKAVSVSFCSSFLFGFCLLPIKALWEVVGRGT